MSLFIDTSVMYALVAAEDERHAAAREVWARVMAEDEDLVTHNYVVLETAAVLQRRFGIPPVRALHREFVPVVEVYWVTADDHDAAFTALEASDRRVVSLVDRVSFYVMRKLGVRRAWCFDEHFAEEGFEVVGA